MTIFNLIHLKTDLFLQFIQNKFMLLPFKRKTTQNPKNKKKDKKKNISKFHFMNDKSSFTEESDIISRDKSILSINKKQQKTR